MSLAVSALLPTHNRAYLLPKVLEGLALQTLDPSKFEVLIIDDGCTDETQQVAAAWQDRLPLRIVRQNHAGIAAAKNLGIFMARGSILVFLDDDDVPEPECLEKHLAAHVAHPEPSVAVLGHTALSPELSRLPLMRHVTEVGCQMFSYGWMTQGQSLKYTEFWGGRSSCKRSFLVEFGVFRPEFRFGCEDIELGWRLSRHGLKVIYESEARTVMIRPLAFDQFCARSYRQGRSQHRFASMHDDPEVQDLCEIERAKQVWVRWRGRYTGHLRWTRKLDNMALEWASADLSLNPQAQQTLHNAYAAAFFLCRAKGIVDAALLSPPPLKLTQRTSILEHGVTEPAG